MNRLRRIGQNNGNADVQENNSWGNEEPQASEVAATQESPPDSDLSVDYTSEAPEPSEGSAPALDSEAMPMYRDADLAMDTSLEPAAVADETTAGDAGDDLPKSGQADAPQDTIESFAIADEATPVGQADRHEALDPVPVNETIAGRYVVQNQLHHGTDRNLYRVVANNQQRCLTCGRLSPLDEGTCGTCGSPLSEQPPADFYLMAESFRREALMQDPTLMQLNLYHPNLVPVIDFFSDTPFGRERYYAVAEPRQGVRLSQLSMPRPPMQVLNWAMQLADALDYLHSRGVIGAGAEADDILVQGDRASLASLQNARSAGSEDATALQSHDLARLASTVYEAYTGSPASMTPDGVLSMPAGTPEPVRAAFRTAVEPHGVGRAISAAEWRDLLATAMETLDELERPGKPVDFVSAGLTDVGLMREQNQDSFGMSEFVQASAERPMRIGLYTIADGMGGHKGGEIACALAVQAFVGEALSRIIAPMASTNGELSMPTPSNESILQGMTRAVQLANERIYKARDNRRNDMGTTLVAAVIAGGKAYVVNVGDSRIYLYTRSRTAAEANTKDATRPLIKGTAPLRRQETAMDDIPDGAEGSLAGVDERGTPLPDYELTQVSIDHSLVQRLVELGQLEPEEAKVHPHRNFVYRSLGGPPPIEVDTFVRTLHPGDRLLLCSDGLNSMIEDADIESVLATEPDPHAACRKLIDLANESGGHDNITVLLVDITEYLPAAAHPFALMGQ